MKRDELIKFLDGYLRLQEIEDFGPQGLQVEADKDEIQRIALAVDAPPPVIQAAADWGADMLLVHHGILWKDLQPIAGPLGRRVRLLLGNQINLYSAHLVLDAHPEVGNNAVLARMLGVDVQEWWCPMGGAMLGVCGPVAAGTTLQALVDLVQEQLGIAPKVQAHGPAAINKVAIVSGFAPDQVAAAAALGADTYVTGETYHANYYAASDYGLNVIFAGHYATETVGVQALGRLLVERFGLTTHFLDFPTGL